MSVQNTYSVFHNGAEFICTNFFDVDTSISGIDIHLDDKYVGEIVGTTIPDIDEEEEYINKFEQEVKEFIDNNL